MHEENSNEQYKYEDDGSSFDGAGDYSSHSPFRAPASPAHSVYNSASNNLQKDNGAFDNDERQPHSFGTGYAFEFGGANNNDGVSSEFWTNHSSILIMYYCYHLKNLLL